MKPHVEAALPRFGYNIARLGASKITAPMDV